MYSSLCVTTAALQMAMEHRRRLLRDRKALIIRLEDALGFGIPCGPGDKIAGMRVVQACRYCGRTALNKGTRSCDGCGAQFQKG